MITEKTMICVYKKIEKTHNLSLKEEFYGSQIFRQES